MTSTLQEAATARQEPWLEYSRSASRSVDGNAADRWTRLPFEQQQMAQTVIIVVGVGAVLTLARFPEAFLILRAQNAGLALTN